MAEHPESLENVNAIEIDGELKEFVNLHHKNVMEAQTDKEMWDAQDVEYYKKRFGIRSTATFPWDGAANFVLPLINSDINKQKPHYLNLVKASPIVTYEPFGPEDVDAARKREKLYDWRLKHRMDFMRPYTIGLDKMLQSGWVVFKIVWSYETRNYTEFLEIEDLNPQVKEALYDDRLTDDGLKLIFEQEFRPDMSFEENVEAIEEAVQKFRNGETSINVLLTEKAKDEPMIVVCDPRTDVIVPKDTMFIEDARFIAYPFWVTKNDLKIAMRDRKYEEYSDNDIDSWAGKGSKDTVGGQSIKGLREGIPNAEDVDDDLVLLWETCLWYDINGDGIKERCISTYPDADPEAVLRFIENPYDHGEWPYKQIRRELIDMSFFSSRGIPALDQDFQDGISTAFNQSINAQTITNAPMLLYRRNAGINARNFKFVPGEAHGVENPQVDVNILQTPNLNQGNFLETQRVLKSWAQENIGQVQFGNAGENNFRGNSRSATEIAVASQFQDANVSFDLQVFQMQMVGVHAQIDSLWNQFGPEEEYLIMTGEQEQKISRREIQGKFNIVPNGRFDNTNPVIRQQLAVQNMQAGINDPWVNQYELRKDFFDSQNPTTTKRLVKTPEQMQKEALAAQQRELELIQTKMESEEFKSQLKNREQVIKTEMEFNKEKNLMILEDSLDARKEKRENKRRVS